MTPLDYIQSVIHRAGWSSGDTASREGDHPIWMVTCSREEQTVIAKDPDRLGAWQAAAKSIALVVGDEVFGRFDLNDEQD
jgi:hypothetical protein